MSIEKLIKYVLYFQGVYFLITALWPLINVESFMNVTGHKNDIWLVKTFGAIIACIALAIFFYLFMQEKGLSVIFLSIITSVTLILADVYYVLNGVISSVYLADAGINLLIVIGWLSRLKQIVKNQKQEPIP
jgi:hypothetical protein